MLLILSFFFSRRHEEGRFVAVLTLKQGTVQRATSIININQPCAYIASASALCCNRPIYNRQGLSPQLMWGDAQAAMYIAPRGREESHLTLSIYTRKPWKTKNGRKRKDSYLFEQRCPCAPSVDSHHPPVYLDPLYGIGQNTLPLKDQRNNNQIAQEKTKKIRDVNDEIWDRDCKAKKSVFGQLQERKGKERKGWMNATTTTSKFKIKGDETR
jgi:hypothetical protein